MRFSMMAVNANRLFDACEGLIVSDLECIKKLFRMGCTDECIHEALDLFFNHVINLYVCGLIDEEFFRHALENIIEGDDIEGVISGANDIRKDIVCAKSLFALRTIRKFKKKS